MHDCTTISRKLRDLICLGFTNVFSPLIKSTITRQSLDNLYLTNNNRVGAVDGQVNLDDLLNATPGGIVRMKNPNALVPLQVQSTFGQAQPMLAYMDEIQQAWRATQDTLFDITNQGEKTRLINAGYDKGIYVNKEYKGAVKQVFNLLDDEVPTKVLDFETGQIVDFKADKSKGNAANSKGQQLVKLDGKHVVDKAAVEYGLLSKNAELGILPQRVLNKLPGHNYKEYKSHFFVEVRPKVIELNSLYTLQSSHNRRILVHHNI